MHGSAPVVIIVDDQPALLFALLRYTQRLVPHYLVIGAANAYEALVHLEHNRVALAIVDQQMPGMSGIEFASRLKQEIGQAPVILMSGSALPATGQEQVVDYYLAKPFDLSELGQVVQQAITHQAGLRSCWAAV
jgi:CheY-like chemotaxis protein